MNRRPRKLALILLETQQMVDDRHTSGRAFGSTVAFERRHLILINNKVRQLLGDRTITARARQIGPLMRSGIEAEYRSKETR